MTDRRRESRHQVVLPISVGGVRAVTRDVSSTGVYFHATTPFTAGTEIEFALPLRTFADSGLELNCRGTVVRVDASGELCGVGARIDLFSLQPKQQQAQIN